MTYNELNAAFQKRLAEIMAGDRKVRYAKSNEWLTIPDDEVFYQCYYPDKPVLKEIPQYWFCSLSGSGIVLSYKKGINEIRALENNPKDTSGHPTIYYKGDGQKKSMQVHNLIALVDEQVNGVSHTFGRAKKYLEEQGKSAFKQKYALEPVNGHHEEKTKVNPDLLYDPDNVQFVSGKLHTAMEPNKKPSTPQEELEYMLHLGAVLDDETDSKGGMVSQSFTDLSTGKTVEHIEAFEMPKHITFRGEAAIVLKQFLNDVQEWMLEKHS